MFRLFEFIPASNVYYSLMIYPDSFFKKKFNIISELKFILVTYTVYIHFMRLDYYYETLEYVETYGISKEENFL